VGNKIFKHVAKKFDHVSRSESKWGSADYSAVELRALAARYRRILERERSSLAKELHDDLIQKLTVLALELSLLDSGWRGSSEGGEAKCEKMRELAQLVTEMIQSVRRMQTELRPKLLDECGLAAAVEWEVGLLAKRCRLETSFKVNPEELQLPQHTVTEMFRVFQAILSNVEGHACASALEVQIDQGSDGVTLRVSDNGKGMSVEQSAGPNALGLLEVRERVGSLHGELSVKSSPGKGTTVIVRVPTDLGPPASGSRPNAE
jgi:signal transduction histidine kinase